MFLRSRVVVASLLVCQSMMLVAPEMAGAQSMGAPSMAVQRDAAYTLILNVGNAVQMLPPGSATARSSGEVMLFLVGVPSMMASSSSGMDMSSTMFDQGVPVNHHLELHIVDNATGAVVNNVSPIIRVTPSGSQVTRELPQVAAMYNAQIGLSDFHYGQNVWLPDESYDVLVMFGNESPIFQDVPVSGGAAPMMTGGMGG